MRQCRFVRASRALRVCAAAVLAVSASLAGAAAPAAGDGSFPTKPLRLIVPYAPGGGGDAVARSIGAKLTEAWGQPVIIDNRGGGGTVIGTDLAAKSPPDGHTILLQTNTHAINATLHPKLPYDTIRDFAPVTLLATSPNILLINPSLAARSVKDFIAFAKANPGKLNYGSSGNGGTGHLAMEMLKSMTGINVVHVPYGGGGPAMKSLLSGEVSVMFNNILAAIPLVKAGRIVALGVTSRQRSPAVPDVPTISEAGVPGFEAIAWFCILAPARTPPAVVKKLNEEIVRVLNMPDIRDRLTGQGLDPVGTGSEEFSRFIRSEIVKWEKVIKGAGIVAN